MYLQLVNGMSSIAPPRHPRHAGSAVGHVGPRVHKCSCDMQGSACVTLLRNQLGVAVVKAAEVALEVHCNNRGLPRWLEEPCCFKLCQASGHQT